MTAPTLRSCVRSGARSRSEARAPGSERCTDWQIDQWNGAGFGEVHRGSGGGYPTAVWASGPDNIWIAGRPGLHFDGATWKPLPIRSDLSIRSIWGTGKEHVWLVANTGDIYRWDEASLRREMSGSFRAVAGSPDRRIH